jgi:hypothetical protein
MGTNEVQQVITALFPSIQNLQETARENSKNLAGLGERVEAISTTTKKVEDAVYGNGQIGMKALLNEQCTKVKALEDRNKLVDDKHESEEAARKNEQRKFKYAVLLTIVTAVVNLVIALAK